MRAGDDFLAGVAAFFEADAAQQVDVEHLRHKVLVRGTIDLWQSGPDVLQMPVLFEGCIECRHGFRHERQYAVACPRPPDEAGAFDFDVCSFQAHGHRICGAACG